MCVCVHINRWGPNLMIIHLEKTKCGCRSGPWSAGQEGKRETKRSRPGVQIAKTNAKTMTPESEIRNIQSSGKNTNKTKQKQKQKSKRTDKRHERTRTLNPGAGRNVVLAMERDAQWRSNCSRYRRKGQTESKISFNTATSGDSWY